MSGHYGMMIFDEAQNTLLWISRHLFYEEFKWLLINSFTKTTNIYRPLPDMMDTILSPLKRSEKFLHDIFVSLVKILCFQNVNK